MPDAIEDVLRRRHPERSRRALLELLAAGRVSVDGAVARPGQAVSAHQRIVVRFPSATVRGEDLGLRVVYRDEHVIAVNKTPGMVVHPARGHATGTVLNGLVHLAGDGSGAGPAHRLDRFTSGLLVCGTSADALASLQGQFERRAVRKAYLAVCVGSPAFDAEEIRAPIGEEADDRTRPKVRGRHARAALTAVSVLARGAGYSLVRCEPRTGRRHQIRLHLASIGHPVAGDELYGGGGSFPRTLLHSWWASLAHPATGAAMTLAAEIWDDMREVLERTGLGPPPAPPRGETPAQA